MKEIAFCTLEDECPYLEGKLCKMEYKFIQSCSKELNQELIYRGWRRFGSYFSRPVCQNCKECLSLRIKALEFKFNKQFKRVMNKNLHTRIYLKKPQLSNEHMYLYEKYHQFMSKKRGWKIYNLSFRQYYNLYIDSSFDYGYELDFYVDEKLVCVDLIDILYDGISSIYCFYDPDFSHLSLGKFSLLTEIKLAQRRQLKYIYLGYFVKNCQSLSYKADYTPNEILHSTSSTCEEAFLWENYNANYSKFKLY